MNDVKEFYTMRVTFQKTGRARYISHLDLNRTMTRAVRRAALPIWYTEGFNRHPYITFASPLSLGYEGERETMDIRLEQEMDPTQVAERLDAVMPEGLHVTGAALAVHKAGDVDRAVYRITVCCPIVVVRDFWEQTEITAQKRTKKKELKTVDLKPVLAVSDASLRETDGGTEIELTLPCNSVDTVNPSLVMSALERFAETGEIAYMVRRLKVLDRNGEIFA